MVKEGQNGLSVLYDLLEFVHEIGQVDIHQNFKQFSEHEWIKFSGIDEAYSNVQDLIEFIKLVIADKK